MKVFIQTGECAAPRGSPPVDDVELSPVAQAAAGAGDRHPAEGGAAEVKVRVAERAEAAGALVGDDDRHGPARADAAVQALDLVAGAAALAVLEQHGAHRPHPRLHRHHVHQRPVPARAACKRSSNQMVMDKSRGSRAWHCSVTRRVKQTGRQN